jgi:hypothetical protein
MESNEKFTRMTVLPMVYNRWGALDAHRVMKNVKDWCFMNFPRDTYALSFVDNGRQVIVRAMFENEHQLALFKQRFAPPEDQA